MDTPKGISGRLTESIMSRVRERLPDIGTHEYNRTYEAVLDGLENTEDVMVVPDNDWAVVAKFRNLPMKRKRAIIAMMDVLLRDDSV